jgi:hypothetical protein
MACRQWDQAEALAGLACAVLHRANPEDNCAAPLVCAVRARAALHRGDVPAARQQLADAERLLLVLTAAIPTWPSGPGSSWPARTSP